MSVVMIGDIWGYNCGRGGRGRPADQTNSRVLLGSRCSCCRKHELYDVLLLRNICPTEREHAATEQMKDRNTLIYMSSVCVVGGLHDGSGLTGFDISNDDGAWRWSHGHLRLQRNHGLSPGCILLLHSLARGLRSQVPTSTCMWWWWWEGRGGGALRSMC